MDNKILTAMEVPSEVVNTSFGIDKEAILQTLRDDIARLMLPADIYIAVLMVLGLLGNLMVCYYYGFKAKRTTNSYFIVVLALYDFTVCAFSMPIEIAYIELSYTLESNVACKVLRFITYVAVIGSIFTLVAIAIDRFKKICKATSPQLTMKKTKLICLAIFGSSLLLSWPAIAIYGSITFDIPNDLGIEQKGSDCHPTNDRQYRKYVGALIIIQFLIFIISSVILIVLYSIIGHTIYKHQKSMRKYKCKSKISSSVNEKSFTTSSFYVEYKSSDETESVDKDKTNAVGKQYHVPVKKQSVGGDRESPNIDRETIKLTLVMLIITVVFIISQLPYLSLAIWRDYKGKHEAEFLSGSSLVGFKIGVRSFFLNNTLNPWIYGIFNSNFRQFFFGWIRINRFS